MPQVSYLARRLLPSELHRRRGAVQHCERLGPRREGVHRKQRSSISDGQLEEATGAGHLLWDWHHRFDMCEWGQRGRCWYRAEQGPCLQPASCACEALRRLRCSGSLTLPLNATKMSINRPPSQTRVETMRSIAQSSSQTSRPLPLRRMALKVGALASSRQRRRPYWVLF